MKRSVLTNQDSWELKSSNFRWSSRRRVRNDLDTRFYFSLFWKSGPLKISDVTELSGILCSSPTSRYPACDRFLRPAHHFDRGHCVSINLLLHAIFSWTIQGILNHILFPLPSQFCVSERFSLKRNSTKGHNFLDLWNCLVCALRVVNGAPVSGKTVVIKVISEGIDFIFKDLQISALWLREICFWFNYYLWVPTTWTR